MFHIILFESLVASNSALYCLVLPSKFLRYVANICLPLAPGAINACPSIDTRVHHGITFEGRET